MAPGWDPPHLVVDRVERRLAKRPPLPGFAVLHGSGTAARTRLRRAGSQPDAVERNEPLRRGEEDHRVMAAPAVRILMRERLAMPEAPPLLERRLDVRVRIEHALPAEQLHGIEEMAARSDRRVDLEAVFHAGGEVVTAVAGRGVHDAGPGLERHVLRQHADRWTRVQRMLETDVLQQLPFHARHRRPEPSARRLGDLGGERLGHDDGTAVDVIRRVVERRVKRDRQIRWNRPRCCRPDEDRDVAAGECRHTRGELARALRSEEKLHVD